MLIQQNEMGGKRKLAAATKQLEQAQSRIAELSRYIKRLYAVSYTHLAKLKIQERMDEKHE